MPPKNWNLKVPDSVADLIRNMHPLMKRKVRAALDEIICEPYSGKALREELAGLMTFRVSTFRVVYRIAKGSVIEIIAIGPRKKIYEETYRLVKKDSLKHQD